MTPADRRVSTTKPTRPRPLAEVEREAIINAIKYCGHDYENAATMLEISSRTIYGKLKKYGLR